MKFIHPLAGFVALVFILNAHATCAADDFPLTGSYTQNVPCKGDGTDPRDAQVRISPHEIDSQVGACTFLDTKRNGNSVLAHVECQLPGGPVLGDVTFTMRSDKTIAFIDRDKNYAALLYRCPK